MGAHRAWRGGVDRGGLGTGRLDGAPDEEEEES
jgi:hypothetical protein